MKRPSQNRIFVMATFILAAGSIYLIPYMRQNYHKPLLEALHINNTQLGLLNSIFGFFAFLSYIPGGLLADKISPRKLLTVSLAATGLSGIYFSSFPSYKMLIALHIFWGISTILPFWAAIIKAVRLWGNSDDQARSFGIFDGGRGIFEAVIISASVAFFAWSGSETRALSISILIYSSVSLIGAFFIWFFMKDSNDEESSSIKFSEIVSAIKIPEVWLISLIVFCAYAAFIGSFDITPFATDGFKQSETFGATLGSFRIWFRPFAAVLAGIIADRISTSKTLRFLFVILSVSFAVFALMPTSASWMSVLWINTGVIAVTVFALRGIYFALYEETKIPRYLTGTVTGIVSLIGFLPDIFLPVINGLLLDTYPGARGHQIYYWILALLAIIGFSGIIAIRRRIKC